MASSVNIFRPAPPLAIVFVHLGINPSPTLIPAANYAQVTHPDSKSILITDNPKRWEKFPGLVIGIDRKNLNHGKHITQRAGYTKKIAGGYWINTYERLFALKELNGHIDENSMVVHIESDVMLQEVHFFFKALEKLSFTEIAVPRMNDELGIASILISKNVRNLLIGLKKLENLAKSNPNICTSDMKLLGLALNREVISELPSLPEKLSDNEERKNHYLFDAAAIGQYLFGRDPIHSENLRISGYENPDFPIKLSLLNWKIQGNSIYAEYKKSNYYFANLHIHSKEILSPPKNDPKRWSRVLMEANSLVERAPSQFVPELIHSTGYSFAVKLEIFLRTRINYKLFNKLWKKS
jgi:hypothetical protein